MGMSMLKKHLIIICCHVIKHILSVYDLVETGLTRFWVKSLSTIPRADECMADNKRAVTRRVRPIQLSDLTSAFLILGIGIGLAILTFLIETIYSTWKRFKRH